MASLRCSPWIASCALLIACGASEHRSNGAPDASMDGAVGLPEGCEPIEATYAGYAEPFFAERCTSCHSASVSVEARLGATVGVDFDTEADIAFHQARIQRRAIDERGMPPGAPLSDCEAAQLESYLASLEGAGACEPACAGRACGADGCGGVCGTCSTGQMCGSEGLCVDEGCEPACAGVACGDDGCGGLCGSCGPGLGCESGMCVCAPQCEGKSCGDDGCGGTCGECTGADVCGFEGQCVCIPSCEGKSCGDDGCGGICGTCDAGKSCVNGACEACVPSSCAGVCGDDGCGGSCTECMGMRECDTRADRCVVNCTPDCAGRECGDDGCGGSCGAVCGGGELCDASGECVCAPSCEAKACGDDGCGGACGECASGLSCSAEGKCGCTPDCSGRECGSDGCGGSCGGCEGGLSCSAGSCVEQCVPSCSGKSCGDDGCGGSCGSCGAAQRCESGACVAASVSFDGVFAIFDKYGCADTGCHGGARPAEGLDLSNASTAAGELVDITADQCARKLVAPGDPAQSYLINKLTGVGMCSGSQMPKGGAALTAAEIDTVRAWISGL